MDGDSDPAADLLLRSHIEVTLLVDADAARDLPDHVLQRVLGERACAIVREYQDDEDD